MAVGLTLVVMVTEKLYHVEVRGHKIKVCRHKSLQAYLSVRAVEEHCRASDYILVGKHCVKKLDGYVCHGVLKNYFKRLHILLLVGKKGGKGIQRIFAAVNLV